MNRTLVILLTSRFSLRNSDLSDINAECIHGIYNISQAEHYVYFPRQTNYPAQPLLVMRLQMQQHDT